jgi:hypothetical protein
MQATNPITEQSIIVSRQHARRPHAAPRHPVRPRSEQTARQDGKPPSRSQVLDAFRDMARGIAAPAAEEQTRDFYRSGGQAWAHSLTEQRSHEVRTRVADAFRAMARGLETDSAHASTLRFYHSSGQRWAQRLG